MHTDFVGVHAKIADCGLLDLLAPPYTVRGFCYTDSSMAINVTLVAMKWTRIHNAVERGQEAKSSGKENQSRVGGAS